uniref:Uncharacterized protein n=1 Tax=Triticum urartu TaxID=4572 RepID=A0A8R7TL30_TRIUA
MHRQDPEKVQKEYIAWEVGSTRGKSYRVQQKQKIFRSTREKMERLDYSRLLLWSRGASTSSCRATSCGTDEPAACHSSTKVKNSC